MGSTNEDGQLSKFHGQNQTVKTIYSCLLGSAPLAMGPDTDPHASLPHLQSRFLTNWHMMGYPNDIQCMLPFILFGLQTHGFLGQLCPLVHKIQL